jgi:hypothetical protein
MPTAQDVSVPAGHPPQAPRFRVTLTDELIYESEQRSSSHCMFAEAVKVARPHAKHVSVDLQTIRFTEGERRFTYLTPRQAQVAIVKFDQGIPCKPFSFQLRNGQSTPSSKAPVKRERAKLLKPKDGSGTGTSVPDKVGGRTPPVDVRSVGRRRAFGLRALEL